MGNSSENNWAAQVRRAWIERAAFARKGIRRRDIVDAFGVSMTQASADLQQVLKDHPGCLTYDLPLKTYLWVKGKRPILEFPWPIKEVFTKLKTDA